MTRYSRQREAILEYLRSTKSHPTAITVYNEVRKKYPNISLATVYRNLGMLAENNTIMRLDCGHGSEHYDATTDNHYHFCCNDCGAVSDLDIPVITDWSILSDYGFHGTVESHFVMFFGLCEQCKNKASHESRNSRSVSETGKKNEQRR